MKYKTQIIAIIATLVLVIAGIGIFQIYSPQYTNVKLIQQGTDALRKHYFDTAIEKFAQAGEYDLADYAKEKAVDFYRAKLTDAKTLQTAIETLEKTKLYGGYADIDKDIAEYQSYAKIIIQIDAKHKNTFARNTVFSAGDIIIATAKSGGKICEGGEWRFKDGHISSYKDRFSNPTYIEIMRVSNNNTTNLSYWIKGINVASVRIAINNK